MKKFTIIAVIFIMTISAASAQLKDILKNKAAEGAKQGAEYGTEHAIDKGLDKLFKKKSKKNKQETIPDPKSMASTDKNVPPENNVADAPVKSLKAYGKFDFVPGEKIIAYDDFLQDNTGDFPAKWNTNASGEIMTIDNHPGKWLNISRQGLYIPEFINSLSDNFTMEFDMLFSPADKPEGPNTASVAFQFINNPGNKTSFNNAEDKSYFELDPYLGQVNIAAYTKGGENILSNEFGVKGLQRQHAFNYHVAVWRQKSRLRVYLDENKVVDVPSLLAEGVKYNNVRFSTSLNNDGSNWFVTNFKYSTGLPDTRNKLLKEGKFTTSGITFATNSASIRPESYGVLKEIAGILKDNTDVHIKIVGHTDNDGDISSNESLSKKRAEAIKNILINEFSIEDSRLTSDGKGETEPAFPNSTAEGKAQNRRVEFIKL